MTQLTVKELRKILFDVENQELTVKQLRKLLFEQDDNEKVTSTMLAGMTKMAEQVAPSYGIMNLRPS